MGESAEATGVEDKVAVGKVMAGCGCVGLLVSVGFNVGLLVNAGLKVGTLVRVGLSAGSEIEL